MQIVTYLDICGNSCIVIGVYIALLWSLPGVQFFDFGGQLLSVGNCCRNIPMNSVA